MEKKIKLPKAVKIVLIGVIAVNTILLIMVFSTKISLSHRYGDIDGDGIINIEDEDIDGDGIPNMKDRDADGDGINNIEDALKAARGLIGRPYDQSMGGFDNIFWKFGGIVCIDVINLSFEKAGIYFEKELRDYFNKNPRIFSSRSWNNPYDKNFARRVMNLRPFFRAKGYILNKRQSRDIKPGDIVIFGTGHTALIEKVTKDGFIAIESAGKRIITMRADREDIFERCLERYGDVVYARIQ